MGQLAAPTPAGGCLLCLPWVLSVPSPSCAFAAWLLLDLSSPFPCSFCFAPPFAGHGNPWRVPTPTPPAHGMCDVSWAKAESQLAAGLSQPQRGTRRLWAVSPRGEQPPSEHLSTVREYRPSLSGFLGDVWQT